MSKLAEYSSWFCWHWIEKKVVAKIYTENIKIYYLCLSVWMQLRLHFCLSFLFIFSLLSTLWEIISPRVYCLSFERFSYFADKLPIWNTEINLIYITLDITPWTFTGTVYPLLSHHNVIYLPSAPIILLFLTSQLYNYKRRQHQFEHR